MSLLRNFCGTIFPIELNFNSVAWDSQISIVSFNLPFKQVFISCFLPMSQPDGHTQWFWPLPCFSSRYRGAFFSLIFQLLFEVHVPHQPCLITQHVVFLGSLVPCAGYITNFTFNKIFLGLDHLLFGWVYPASPNKTEVVKLVFPCRVILINFATWVIYNWNGILEYLSFLQIPLSLLLFFCLF